MFLEYPWACRLLSHHGEVSEILTSGSYQRVRNPSKADTKLQRYLSSRVTESDPLIREAGVEYMRKSTASWGTFLLSSPRSSQTHFDFIILVSCFLAVLNCYSTDLIRYCEYKVVIAGGIAHLPESFLMPCLSKEKLAEQSTRGVSRANYLKETTKRRVPARSAELDDQTDASTPEKKREKARKLAEPLFSLACQSWSCGPSLLKLDWLGPLEGTDYQD